jgi:CHASE3 domain sensor protein
MKSMQPWQERLTTTVIIALAVILILAGMLVWALLFFRSTL